MVAIKFFYTATLLSLALAAAQNGNGGQNNGVANGNNGNNNNNNNGNNGNNDAATGTGGNDANGTTLDADAVQTGSFSDGTQGDGVEDGQAASQTSQNNFINFCSGQTLTNGLQVTDGSCNGIVMGQIPAKAKMISSILTFPQEGQTVQANQDFDITLQVNNLQAGSFTNPDTTYYSAPQTLQGGEVVGHTHITVQDLGNSLNPTQPPDATQFAFFKGINDAGNGNGGLKATVTGGLPAGNFRVCTMTSASNHQPVIMPVAQRGAQDDCTKFTVVDNGGNNNNNNNNNGQNNNNNNNQNNGQNNNGQNNNGQNNAKGKGKRLARLARRSFVA